MLSDIKRNKMALYVFIGKCTTADSGMVDLLGRYSYSSRALHDGHVAVAPELNVFNASVVQLEVEAGEDGRDREI